MKCGKFLFMALCLVYCSCGNQSTSDESTETLARDTAIKTIGTIEILDEGARSILASDAAMEVLGEGHDWTEGPVWVASESMLLYSDIPPNSIFKWKEGEGTSLFLKPSGFTEALERKGEPGSNGLLLNSKNELILCQHGDRRIAKYLGTFDDPKPSYATVIDRYGGKRFNSPNDATFAADGTLFFTDPPYGLEGNVNDPLKEIPFQGVYRLDGDGSLSLLTDQMSRPNGIALSTDERVLYVANSDPERAVWMAYQLDDKNNIADGRVFFDATDLVGKEKGLPDGLKVHPNGMIFATGPGGVWIFSPEGQVLAKLKTGEATANCAFDDKHRFLFITADMYLLRVPLKV